MARVAAGHTARVSDAGVADEVVGEGRAARAVAAHDGLELPVFLGKTVFVLGDVAEDFLETQNLVLERFDVELFALAVGTLRLTVKLLPPGEGRFAVRLGPTSFWGVAICARLVYEGCVRLGVGQYLSRPLVQEGLLTTGLLFC